MKTVYLLIVLCFLILVPFYKQNEAIANSNATEFVQLADGWQIKKFKDGATTCYILLGNNNSYTPSMSCVRP